MKKGIRDLGLENQMICIHASMKSFGHVNGGSQAILDAFLDCGCTVMVPTFTYDYLVKPEKEIKRNGVNYISFFQKWTSNAGHYHKSINEIAPDMGIFPKTLLQNPTRLRGEHPINSFTALGTRASELIAGQNAIDVYAPFKKLYDENGFVLLMGTDLTSMTSIHYAEQLAGRNLFVRWANNENGDRIDTLTGGCSEGFYHFEELLAGYEKRRYVGSSLWRLFSAQDVIDVCSQAIRTDPMITHCDNDDCQRCADAIAGGPIRE